MYFRNEEELKLVKEFIAQMRSNKGQKPKIQPEAASVPQPKPAQANIKLPGFLVDVMNGGSFPAMEELTKSEQAILYDPTINTLVNQYRQTKKFDLAVQIRERLDEIGVDF